jgi:hypothetical protein
MEGHLHILSSDDGRPCKAETCGEEEGELKIETEVCPDDYNLN